VSNYFTIILAVDRRSCC